jgi:hypothetical protein
MVMVMVRFRISEVDKLSLFRPNLEVRSPRVAMLIRVWQPRVEKDGSAALCVFEGATELRRGWHARAWDKSALGPNVVHQPRLCRLKLIAHFGLRDWEWGWMWFQGNL